MATPSNLVKLDSLTELSIVSAVQERYSEDEIYTYVGDMLLACNPFKPLGIYMDEHKKLYHLAASLSPEPHIYAVAQRAFKNLVQLNQDQCCLISGESGAGKTETAKLFINHLLNSDTNVATVVERRILESQPFLEAFGNAKTLMNDNSSRFGKYIEIKFRNNRVVGAKIQRYLLEKSRIVARLPGENNFHVFYYLLTGSPAWLREGLALLDADRYNYIVEGSHRIKRKESLNKRQARCTSKYELPGADVVSDVEKYLELIETMHVLDFSKEEIVEIQAILAGILMLGNIDFVDDDNDNDSATSMIRGSAPVITFCRLLQIPADFFSTILVSKVMVTRSETIVKGLTCQQSVDKRDSIAKALYMNLFDWFVAKFNLRLKPSDMGPHPTIAVLDIFGFENFNPNGFDQLCINTANEQLQYYFNEQIFKWEVEEYKSEGIRVDDIGYVDNLKQIELILGRPIGVFSLLDEEGQLSKGSDASWVAKMAKRFSKNPVFKQDKFKPLDFTIEHYAGVIIYSAQGMVDRNRNAHAPEFVHLVLNSDCKLLRGMFEAHDLHYRSSKRMNRNSKLMDNNLGADHNKSKNNRRKKRPLHTIAATFRTSLTMLMAKLQASTPHFVRCIKPNMLQEPDTFDDPIVQQQLRYTGVMETARIRSQGYAIRMPFSEFIHHYKIIVFPYTLKVPQNGVTCTKILDGANLSTWKIGHSKVFLKYHHKDSLVKIIEMYNQHAARISRVWRCHRARAVLLEMREARERARAQATALAEHEQRVRLEQQQAQREADLLAQQNEEAEERRQSRANVNQDSSYSVQDEGNALEDEDEDFNDWGDLAEVCDLNADDDIWEDSSELDGDSADDSDTTSHEGSVKDYLWEKEIEDTFPDLDTLMVPKQLLQQQQNQEQQPQHQQQHQQHHHQQHQHSKLDSPVKSVISTSVDKTGTVSKGDVAGARAMFQAMLDANKNKSKPKSSPTPTRTNSSAVGRVRSNWEAKFSNGDSEPSQSKQIDIVRGISVSKASQNIHHLDFTQMMPAKSFKTGPGMPKMIKKRPKASLPPMLPSIETFVDDEDGVDTLMRRREELSGFLAELSLQRLYGRLVIEIGIKTPQNFLRYSEVELRNFGFREDHIKKIFKELTKNKKAKKHNRFN